MCVPTVLSSAGAVFHLFVCLLVGVSVGPCVCSKKANKLCLLIRNRYLDMNMCHVKLQM